MPYGVILCLLLEILKSDNSTRIEYLKKFDKSVEILITRRELNI